ncbi:hypothetical protein DT076_03540 [Desertihabitans brevis]|uniref:DUF4175 domain-containing protein n=1 Tax=Desertihabitans brevis TaxID=2268447 RepID=A0A367YX94_9ACTN|nr:hypothetical protein DT076_03540 [Desertihabitans brevis]
MAVNLNDFLGDHPWLLWLALAALLAAARLVVADRRLLPVAGAVALTAVVAALWPAGWWLQLLVALVLAGAAVWWARPRVGRPA